MTGVTVLRFDEGAKAGCDISGGGPASRETPLTSPVTADNPINAIVFLVDLLLAWQPVTA